MKTVGDNLATMAESVKDSAALLLQHSSLRRWNEPGSIVLINLDGDFAWGELDVAGQQVQAETLKNYRRLSAIVAALLNEQPQSILNEFTSNEALIIKLLEQQSSTTLETLVKARESLNHAVDNINTLVTNLYDGSQKCPFYLPDTNALLANPDLEGWRFPDVPKLHIGLLPTVLSELDKLKLHRSESVQEKAKGIITRIKGYRSRGRLSEGVTLTKGISTLRTFAEEPDFSRTLHWLDKDNNDDRILASVLDVMRLYPHSPVILVTRDLNLQNKAEHACFHFAEPPAHP